MAGIISYGVHVPRYRIKLSEIADAWQKDGQEIASALKVAEKAVPNIDEDAVTLGVEAAFRALTTGGIAASQLQSVFVGSESHPYAVNPTSSIIAEILGVGNDYFAADLEFACKAATAGFGVTVGLVDGKKIEYGLVVGSDTAQGKPADALEFTAASAAAAYILGNKNPIAEVLAMSSFTSDTPDFWRRDGSKYPSHAGRFTGEPAYFHHVMSETKKLFAQTNLTPSDFAYCVFHMPNGKFPQVVAKKLGFTLEQIKPSLTVAKIGNPYSAAALFGLSAVLDIAKPNEKILFVSYGSGAGSDGFVFETTKELTKFQKKNEPISKRIENKEYVSYVEYLRKLRSI
jgi:hydroxymethylglutaryl-CoA synthase